MGRASRPVHETWMSQRHFCGSVSSIEAQLAERMSRNSNGGSFSVRQTSHGTLRSTHTTISSEDSGNPFDEGSSTAFVMATGSGRMSSPAGVSPVSEPSGSAEDVAVGRPASAAPTKATGLPAPSAALAGAAALSSSSLPLPTAPPLTRGGSSSTVLLNAQLASMHAKLSESEAARRRLEAELAAHRESASTVADAHAAALEQERQRYRREVEFVRAGADAAAAQRDAAMAKRKESHERALRRAVHQAEERGVAAAAHAAAERELAHASALREQATRYDEQLTATRGQLIDLAMKVRALCREGQWPGARIAVERIADQANAAGALNADMAYQILCAAIVCASRGGEEARVACAGWPPDPPDTSKC